MKDSKKETKKLMTTEEYISLREKAIAKLNGCKEFDGESCILGKQRILTEEKEALLEQLAGDYEYLTVPLELYLTDEFWRILKVESNKRIRYIKLQDIQEEGT